MKRLALCILSTLIMSVPMIAHAANIDLVKFLRPLEAQIIMTLDDGILIDKGAAERVAPGDFFVVITKEKRLIHPQTGQILDTLLEYGALCEVTRVKQDIAYCSSTDKQELPTNGAKLHRFENIPLFFEDISGDGFEIFSSLRTKLPHLHWQEYVAKTKTDQLLKRPSLLIRHTKGQLQLLTNNERILFSEKLNSVPSHPSPASELTPTIQQTTSGLNRLQTKTAAPALKGLLRIKLPLNTEVHALEIDDLDRDGSPEIILGLDQALVIGHLKDGKFFEQTRIALQGYQQITDISAIDLDRDGLPEIVVSAIENNNARSGIYKYTDSKITRQATAHLLFGSFTTLQGEKILLGTSKFSLLNLKPEFYRIGLKDNQIVKAPFSLPAASQPYGIARLKDAQGQALLAQITEDNHLKVTNSNNETIWSSEDHYGGTTRFITIPEAGAKNAGNDEKIFLRAKLLSSPDQTLLVTKYMGKKFFKNSQSYTNGYVVELLWNGFAMEEIASSEKLDGHITDLVQADLDNDGTLDLIAAILYKKKDFFRKPVSGLVFIPNERE